MVVGALLLLVAMVGLLLVPVVLMVVALVDLVQRGDAEWVAAEQDRMTWLFVTLLVALIGPVLYLTVARPRLDEARLRLHSIDTIGAPLPPPPS